MLRLAEGRNVVLRDQIDGESGMTLVELMAAITVFAIGVLAIAATAGFALETTRVARTRQQATAATVAAIERARSYEFDDIAVPTAATTDTEFSHTGDPGDLEDIIFSSTSPLTFQQTSGALTITTYVTWYDDPDTTSTAEDAKRVTAVATWEEGSGDHEVRQSTLVAEARRGLPVPDFTLSQPTGPDPNAWNCFVHTLTNNGGEDGYDFQLASGSTADGGWAWKSAGWKAMAWLGDPTMVANEDSSVRMRDVTGDLVPDSQVRVARGEQVSLRVCYEPIPSEPHSDHNHVVVVRSAFDSSVQRQAVNDLVIPADQLNLTLHDDRAADGSNPPWTGTGTVLGMEPDQPVYTSLVDYDGDGIEGLRLDSTTTAASVLWDHEFGQARSVGGTQFLTLWVRLTELDGTLLDGGTATLSASISEPGGSSIGSDTRTVVFEPDSDGTDDGWFGVTFSIDVVTTTSFQAADTLRLQVTCDEGASDGICHLAYDVQGTYPAILQVNAP